MLKKGKVMNELNRLQEENKQLKKELDDHYSGKKLMFSTALIIGMSFVVYGLDKLTGLVLVHPYLNCAIAIYALGFFAIGYLKK